MTAAQWLSQHATSRIPHARFACLEGCGFCCTYPPEVQKDTWQAISETTGLKDIGVDENGTLYLPLQSGCGACVLLRDRQCRDYQHRPKHCRLFPFHVYFGRTVEVYANGVCPGLDPQEVSTSDVPTAVSAALATVDVAELSRKSDEALDTHAEFERRARAAGAWGDVDSARRTLLSATRITQDAWNVALRAFEEERDELLPTMVLPGPGFEWRMWRVRGGKTERVRFEEDGALTTVGTAPAPERPRALSRPTRRVLERLAGYECFVGAAFDLVDASGYEVTVAEAVDTLLCEMAAGLAVREQLLQLEGLPADERGLAAAYEPEFYDLPSIGGWL